MTILKDYLDKLKDCAEGGAGTCRNADIVQELQDKVERLTVYISELCRPIEDSAANAYMSIADCIQRVQKMAAELEQARARIAQLEPRECPLPEVAGWYWAKLTIDDAWFPVHILPRFQSADLVAQYGDEIIPIHLFEHWSGPILPPGEVPK